MLYEVITGRGITWGMAHFINVTGQWSQMCSKLVRFDCDLSLDINDPQMKEHRVNHQPDVYLRQGLSNVITSYSIHYTKLYELRGGYIFISD